MDSRLVSSLQKMTLARYYLAGCRWFSGCSGVSISVDASRIGGKDLLAGVILGWSEGRYQAMWAVPQAPCTLTRWSGFNLHDPPGKTMFQIPDPAKVFCTIKYVFR